jgi:hypothetical protein
LDIVEYLPRATNSIEMAALSLRQTQAPFEDRRLLPSHLRLALWLTGCVYGDTNFFILCDRVEMSAPTARQYPAHCSTTTLKKRVIATTS